LTQWTAANGPISVSVVWATLSTPLADNKKQFIVTHPQFIILQGERQIEASPIRVAFTKSLLLRFTSSKRKHNGYRQTEELLHFWYFYPYLAVTTISPKQNRTELTFNKLRLSNRYPLVFIERGPAACSSCGYWRRRTQRTTPPLSAPAGTAAGAWPRSPPAARDGEGNHLAFMLCYPWPLCAHPRYAADGSRAG
jgi:hypothetical protein